MNRSVILKSALIFIAAYLVSLGLWLGIKNYYGMAVTTVASYAAAIVKNVKIVEMKREKDIVTVGFIPKKYGVTILQTSINVPISNYTFNAPLTFAIMAAFYPFLKRRRVYAEALLIMVVVHFLFVFSYEAHGLTSELEKQGYEKSSEAVHVFWEFLWGFINNMVVRFEPFLIGAYLYFFRDSARKPAAADGPKEKTHTEAQPKRAKKGRWKKK
ncbi:MAG: exosortase H-associated membrane protein [Candidatus Dadabacteria bacterium]